MNERKLMAEILASQAADEGIVIGVGRFLIQDSLINLWLDGKGSDKASSDEFIAYAELRESKWMQIAETWSVVKRREVEYGLELVASEEQSRPQGHREHRRMRMRIDQSTGYLSSRARLAGLFSELVELSDTLTVKESWLPECVLCESKL
ncbi:hypothetical protein ACWDUH_04915 [Micromonospora wenchangensis]